MSLIAYSSLRLQQWVSIVASLCLLFCSALLLQETYWYGFQSVQIGSWPAPFGITLMTDVFGALMVLVTAIICSLASLYGLFALKATYLRSGFIPLFFTLILGVNGAFLTVDLFNLFVWFEVMLISSFVLLSMGGSRPQAEGALKYVALNLLSSAFLLTGIGLLYALTGSLNMIDLGMKLSLLSETRADLILGVSLLFAMSFGLKAGVFPLYSWLPASYHTPPTLISAVFAGLLTKVGVFAFFRVFSLVFPPHDLFFQSVGVIAGLTMFFGVIGAVAQKDIRRILSFHIISQIGYMMLGLALLQAEDPSVRVMGMASAIFFIIHNIFAKSNLFLIGGLVERLQGSQELKKVGGLFERAPFLTALFLVSALALAGVPPLSGFWAKLGVIQASFRAEAFVLAAVALLTSIFTLMSMLKIWNQAFWKPLPEGVGETKPLGRAEKFSFYAPILVLAALCVWIGLQPQTLYQFTERSAQQLQSIEMYRSALPFEAGKEAKLP